MDVPIITMINVATMSVNQFKALRGVRTGYWTIQGVTFTYQVLVNKVAFCSEFGYIDFTKCPLIEFRMVKVW